MRTFVITAIALLVMYSRSYGQKLMIGPRVGMDVGSIAWDSASYGTNKSTTLGLIGGAQLDVWFSDDIALSTGILLDQKGWHEDDVSYPTAATNDLTLNYIEIPLLFKLGLAGGIFHPYVFAGPSLGYMFWGYTTQRPNGVSAKIDEELNKFDFSIVGGAGLAYNLASGAQIFIDGGYAFGFSNIISADETGALYQFYFGTGYSPLKPVGTIKTRDIRIAAGILFPI